MASSVDVARQSLIESGFWTQEDSSIADRVDKIVQDRFRLTTEAGLDLCSVALFDKPLIHEVIKSFFKESVMGFYRTFGQTRRNYCVLNRKSPELRMLVVLLWSSGSQMIFQSEAHLHLLNAVGAGNGLLAIPDERLAQLGITPVRGELKHGGFSIWDARGGIKVLKGKVSMIGIMIPDEAQHWAKMPLPKSLSSTVTEMEGRGECMGMKFNFELEDSGEDIVSGGASQP